MLDILAWAVFGFILAVMVMISVATIRFSEEPSSSEAKEKLLKSKGKSARVEKNLVCSYSVGGRQPYTNY